LIEVTLVWAGAVKLHLTKFGVASFLQVICCAAGAARTSALTAPAKHRIVSQIKVFM
jgi:hypothetical protein